MLTPELIDAIDHADLDRLRQTLKRTCRRSNDAQSLVEEQLLITVKANNSASNHPEVIELCSDGPNTASSSIRPSAYAGNVSVPNKRQQPRYAFCANCKQEFDMTSNSHGDCVYHDGCLEVDWTPRDTDWNGKKIKMEVWADWDEDCHGPIDTKSNREEFPEGFSWSCCDRNGTFAEGCQVRKHVVDEGYRPKAKKRKNY